MLEIIAAIEAAVKAGIDLAPLVAKLYQTFQPGAPAPTDADFQAMRDLEASLTAQLNADMPAEVP